MADQAAPCRAREYLLDLTALAGGAVMTLALAPFEFWPFAFLSPALLFFSIRQAETRRILLRFYLFNVAMFGSGVSWIWVSVHEHGHASVVLATFLVGLLVLAYSLICLPLAWVFARFFRSGVMAMVPGFCSIWVLQEWIRTWFLTGFPWMYLGYGAMNTPLINLAPVGGVFMVSLATVVVATSLTVALWRRQWAWLLPVAVLVACGLALGEVSFTSRVDSRSVSLVQGNIDQHVKWRPGMRAPIMRRYVAMSANEWGRDLIVWPEAAITVFREDAAGFLDELAAQAKQSGSAVVLGIPDQGEDGRFENTVLALGAGQGQYIKRRLVPFGEYVPLEGLLRGLIRLFDLPMARNRPGPMQQPPLRVHDLVLSTSICYEIIYPSLVRTAAANPDLLLTISNDTWFGESLGPHQHLQMARMRAIELGRSLVRGTNNGITAIIDWRGEITARLPQFKAGVLRGEVEIRAGRTPYLQAGDAPVLVICVLLLAAGLVRPRRMNI